MDGTCLLFYQNQRPEHPDRPGLFWHLYFLKRRVGIPCGVKKSKIWISCFFPTTSTCDISTLKVIFKNNPKVKVLAPLQMKSLIHSINPAITVIEMGWYRRIKTEKDLTITYLPAKHWCRRYLHDYNRILWGSFMIQSPPKRSILQETPLMTDIFRKFQHFSFRLKWFSCP